MTIKLADQSDLPRILTLFKIGFGQDEQMYPLHRAQNLFVAKEGTETVGAGAFWQSSLHTKVPRIAITVKESLRRKGIGRDIHHTLINSKDLPFGVDGCCFDCDTTAISFLTHLGYNPCLDCVMPVVDTTFVFPNIWIPSEVKIQSFKDVKNTLDRKLILSFLIDRYTQSHSWNPVTLPKDHPDWEDLAFDGIDEDLSLVAIDKNTLVGASTADAQGKELQIHWTFACASEVLAEVNLLKAMIGRQFQLAHERGLKTATMECDSTDPGIFQVNQSLTAISSETWRRFRYLP